MLLRLIHITLAILLLASSAGANLSVHYCGGQIAEWALFVQSDNCGMPQQVAEEQVKDTDNDTPQIKPTPCCEDVLSYHKLDVEQPNQDADDTTLIQGELVAVAAIVSAEATSQPRSFPLSSPTVRPPPDPLQLRQRIAQLTVRLI